MFKYLSKISIDDAIESAYLASKMLEFRYVVSEMKANERIQKCAEQTIEEIERIENVKIGNFSAEAVSKYTRSMSEWLSASILTKKLQLSDLLEAEKTIDSWLEESPALGREMAFDLSNTSALKE